MSAGGNLPCPTCRHEESLWGRCVACGMTWEQQAEARNQEVPGEWSVMSDIPARLALVVAAAIEQQRIDNTRPTDMPRSCDVCRGMPDHTPTCPTRMVGR